MEVQVLCFAPPTETRPARHVAGRGSLCVAAQLAGRGSLCVAVAIIASAPSTARAHEGTEPAAHVAMPTQITAGLTSLCPTRATVGRREAAALACFGGEVTLAFSPEPEAADTFAIRLRFGYESPLFEEADPAQRQALFEEAHAFRAAVTPEYVAVRFGNWVNVTVGPSLGFVGLLLGDDERQLFAPGVHVGGAMAVRGFVTYHTGFFAETAFGAGIYLHETADVTSRTLGRVTLGWIDRF